MREDICVPVRVQTDMIPINFYKHFIYSWKVEMIDLSGSIFLWKEVVNERNQNKRMQQGSKAEKSCIQDAKRTDTGRTAESEGEPSGDFKGI